MVRRHNPHEGDYGGENHQCGQEPCHQRKTGNADIPRQGKKRKNGEEQDSYENPAVGTWKRMKI